jgi:hypothetical protein
MLLNITKLEATKRWLSLFRDRAPHSGQSSQLSLKANGRNPKSFPILESIPVSLPLEVASTKS